MRLKLLSSMAPREVLAAGIAAYQESHPTSIEAEAAGGVEVARRVAVGEAVDIVVLSSDAIDKLIEGGQLSAAGRVDLMNSEIAVAVPAGAPRPSLVDEAAVRAAVVAAASVSYSTGPSGRYLNRGCGHAPDESLVPRSGNSKRSDLDLHSAGGREHPSRRALPVLS
jgi:molybdate transport system substrate-binding protein